jgi:hypothetical protein
MRLFRARFARATLECKPLRAMPPTVRGMAFALDRGPTVD